MQSNNTALKTGFPAKKISRNIQEQIDGMTCRYSDLMFPKDANPNNTIFPRGTIFGGQLMQYMLNACADTIASFPEGYHLIPTNIKEIKFITPVFEKDMLSIYGKVDERTQQLSTFNHQKIITVNSVAPVLRARPSSLKEMLLNNKLKSKPGLTGHISFTPIHPDELPEFKHASGEITPKIAHIKETYDPVIQLTPPTDAQTHDGRIRTGWLLSKMDIAAAGASMGLVHYGEKVTKQNNYQWQRKLPEKAQKTFKALNTLFERENYFTVTSAVKNIQMFGAAAAGDHLELYTRINGVREDKPSIINVEIHALAYASHRNGGNSHTSLPRRVISGDFEMACMDIKTLKPAKIPPYLSVINEIKAEDDKAGSAYKTPFWINPYSLT